MSENRRKPKKNNVVCTVKTPAMTFMLINWVWYGFIDLSAQPTRDWWDGIKIPPN